MLRVGHEVVGVAGFVIPGMRVDVLISGNPPGADAASGSRVKTLLQNIQVLSAGANIQKDAEGKPVQVQELNLVLGWGHQCRQVCLARHCVLYPL